MVFLFFMINSSLTAQADQAPSITAEGRQVFCIGNPINIVTNFTITDPDDISIPSFFIQISEGYQVNFDELILTGNHPFIDASWNITEGKLTLSSAIPGGEILLTDLENAVKEIVFITTATNTTEEKFFSLSVTDANYLPLTDHFYEFVSNEGITWTDAKIAAENRNYYGRQGYLATLTTQVEADFAGKQVSGAGWIGGSDADSPNVWKWVTGPEAGTDNEIFWNGALNGSSPTFAFWNTGEPNNFGNSGEDYVHVTAPGVGIAGSWNDLTNTGDASGDYQPKGYIVEYGTPTDPPLNIVATTSIYTPQIIAINNPVVCESDSATMTAIPSEGDIFWYRTPTPGTEPEFAMGNNFTINNTTETTTYYAAISVNGCITLPRTAVTVTVVQKPTIISFSGDRICSGSATLRAQASNGEVYWFESQTSTSPLFIGNNFETPTISATRSYFVEANNSFCDSSNRIEVVAELDDTIPQFDVSQNTYILCTDIGNIDLETKNPQGNYNYVWRKEGELLTVNTATLNVNSSGNYTVRAVSDAGCESPDQNILVTISEKATITKDDVLITDDSENNSIRITNPNLGNGYYEYALDDEFGSYNSVGYFNNLATGIHTLYIRDANGCGTERFIFSILSYPKFFTPNEDGINDVWNIAGFDRSFYTVSDILIYNRFGNLIYKIDKNSQGWDGTYQGKNLPSNNYWFSATLTDINGLQIKKTGNFSLIRK